MIDLHAHILPGLDDGPATEADALKMARLAVEDGIKVMVATPHCLDGRYDNFPKAILRACGRFNGRLRSEGIDLQVLPGAEIRFCPELVAAMDRGRLMTLGDTGRYFLMELPDTFVDQDVAEVAFRMVGQGRVPIVCHPERNLSIQKNPRRLTPILAAGALSQITGDSLTGRFGGRARTTAIRLVETGRVHFVGSDAHSPGSRPPRLAEALDVLCTLAGPEALRAIGSVMPRMVIDGAPVPSRLRNVGALSKPPERTAGVLQRLGLRFGLRNPKRSA